MRQIAGQLGLSPKAVASYLRRRDIPSLHHRGRDYVLDLAQMRSLLGDGLRQDAIAERLNVHVTTVQKAIRRIRKTGTVDTARTGPRSTDQHPDWSGGRTADKHGYVLVYAPMHPHCRKSGKVYEHRLVMEVVLGRYLTPDEVPDHLDNCPYHNWPDNLMLYATNADHLRAELGGRVKATPRQSIPGAYGSTQKLLRCPSEDETLAQCPLEIRQKLALFVDAHRPTTQHRKMARRQFLRSGARLDPFPPPCPA